MKWPPFSISYFDSWPNARLRGYKHNPRKVFEQGYFPLCARIFEFLVQTPIFKKFVLMVYKS